MHSPTRMITIFFVLCVTLVAALAVFAQQPPDSATLIQQLRSLATTDKATLELMRLGRSDVHVRNYLISQLPSMIAGGPLDSRPWSNAVKISGELKIAEAVPALAKWLTSAVSPGTVSFTQTVRLEDNPAAKALAQIGDPSVPTISTILKRGDLRQRWEAALVLSNIGSPMAKQKLRKHLDQEPDVSLRDFIERTLE
jgi:hypothetical protein